MKLSKLSFWRQNKFVLLCTISVALTASFCQVSFAQSEPEANVIEEIVVTSQRSIRAMRLEMESSELALYDIFNEKFAGTDYEMTCVRERGTKYEFDPIPNSWAERVCRSKASHRLRRQQIHDFTEMLIAEQQGYVGVPVDIDYYAATAKEHDNQYLEKVSELLAENPEYGEALSKYTSAKTSYEAAKKVDMESNFITRLFKRED